jgi:hypothetical protein
VGIEADEVIAGRQDESTVAGRDDDEEFLRHELSPD